MQRTGAEYGNVYDHFNTVYEWDNGVKCFSSCRQWVDCSTNVSDNIFGTTGRCLFQDHLIESYGGENWKYEQTGPDDMYQTWRPLYNEGKVDLMISGHTHHYEIRPPVEGQCDYPTIIGGAPQKGAATVIRVDATADHLGVTMMRDDGQVVGTYAIHRVKADSPAAP